MIKHQHVKNKCSMFANCTNVHYDIYEAKVVEEVFKAGWIHWRKPFFICMQRWKTSNLSADRIKKFCLQSSILLQCSRCGQCDHKLHLQGMKVGHHESCPVYPPKTVSEPCPQKGHLTTSVFQISQPPTLPLPCSSHPTDKPCSVFFWELFSIVSSERFIEVWDFLFLQLIILHCTQKVPLSIIAVSWGS